MKSNLKETKGLIFVGCSFTWGQGLYYYSNLESLIEPSVPYSYERKLLTTAHVKFMEKNRFARLVANEFDTFEIVRDVNGGSDDGNIEYFKFFFKSEQYSDYKYLIYQLTEPFRCDIEFNYHDVDYKFNFVFEKERKSSKIDILFNYLNHNNIDYEEWEKSHALKVLNSVKEFLMFVETKKIKIIILTWPEIYVEHIIKDEWLRERFIMFSDNVKSLETLMKDSKMIINYDTENFLIPPTDLHPSLKCHKLIAETIINKIKND